MTPHRFDYSGNSRRLMLEGSWVRFPTKIFTDFMILNLIMRQGYTNDGCFDDGRFDDGRFDDDQFRRRIHYVPPFWIH